MKRNRTNGISLGLSLLLLGIAASVAALAVNPEANLTHASPAPSAAASAIASTGAPPAALAAAATAPAAGAVDGVELSAAERLAGRSLGATPLMSDLREMCDGLGGRPTGSPACERAIDWAAAKFRAAGLTSVTTESFDMPGLWLPQTAEAECLAPESFPIRIAAAPYAGQTPGGRPIEAPLVDAGSGLAEEFERLGDSARGAIAIVRNPEMRTFEDLFEEYMRTPGLLASARKAQVAALLIQSTRPRGLLYRHPVTFNGTSATIPVAIASRETSERLMRLREHGPVRVRLTISNRTGGPYKSRNVIAEIRGREKPDEIVLLGAHLDSWELGTGAEDNGVNAAMVIDVARGFRQLGLVPRRTVRFALFTGEEQGLWGSAGYVKSHASELDGHVCAVIFDTGSGRTSGFLLSGREELRAPVNAALSAVSGLGAGEQAPDAFDGTDNFDFLLSGVPNLIANQDAVPYLPDYHAESDTYDKTNAREAAANEAIASVLIWGLAESPQRMAPRLSKAQTEKLISDTKLEEQMRAFGHWDDWRSGKRGVAKTGN